MSYRADTGPILESQGYEHVTHWQLMTLPSGLVDFEYWSHPTDPQPTPEQVDAWGLDWAREVKLAELIAHADMIANGGARISGAGGTDFWVGTSESEQRYYLTITSQIGAYGWLESNAPALQVQRVDNDKLLDLRPDEGLWQAFTNALAQDFVGRYYNARTECAGDIEAAHDTGDEALVRAIDVTARWTDFQGATRIDARTFEVPGDQRELFRRGTQVDVFDGAKSVYGRCNEPILNGNTRVSLDFRNDDAIPESLIQVAADEYQWPEWRAWVPPGADG